MDWPINISVKGAVGKCEMDVNDYYYNQKHREREPGEMYMELGWRYDTVLRNSVIPVWWRWGN